MPDWAAALFRAIGPRPALGTAVTMLAVTTAVTLAAWLLPSLQTPGPALSASRRTVFLSPGRTCLEEPLSWQPAVSTGHCRGLCIARSGCIAFSQTGDGICSLLAGCSATQSCSGCTTGLLPSISLPAQPGPPRPALPRHHKAGRALWRGPAEPRLPPRYRPPRPGCSWRVEVGRACSVPRPDLIGLVYTGSLGECSAKCRARPGCEALTWRGQGGGGLERAGPCLLLPSCRTTVWCRGCRR